MSEANFIKLKLQVEHLLNIHAQLIAENRLLRKKLLQSMQSQTVLANKKDVIHKRLKTIISQIKEEMV
jgi:uncharacterized protein (TIGR02449 family)